MFYRILEMISLAELCKHNIVHITSDRSTVESLLVYYFDTCDENFFYLVGPDPVAMSPKFTTPTFLDACVPMHITLYIILIVLSVHTISNTALEIVPDRHQYQEVFVHRTEVYY